MLKRLLVGLDGSALAEASLPYAEVLARASDARVILVRVVADDDGPNGDLREESVVQHAERHEPVAYLDGVAERLGPRGIVAETAVVAGRSGEMLVEEAAVRQADLIIVATHGRSGLGRWVFGSVAETVLARSSVPVLVVRAWSPPHPLAQPKGKPTIVVPLDGSSLAECVLPPAEELARLLGAQICLVRAIPLPYVAPSLEEAMGPVYTLDVRDELEREANDYLATVAQRLRRAGIGVACTVGVGSPAGEILAAAREREAGLVVVATHERTGLARTLFGSVALEVLHRLDLPVLLVRGTSPVSSG